MTRGDDERRLDIIEACTSLAQVVAARGVDWDGIAGLRIVLAHHYHRTQPELIWRFASVEAPSLLDALSE